MSLPRRAVGNIRLLLLALLWLLVLGCVGQREWDRMTEETRAELVGVE